MSWQPGDEVLYRFRRLDGSIGSVTPATVVRDDGSRLLCWIPDGTPCWATRLIDGRRQRDAPLHERFRIARKPVRTSWRGCSNLRLVDEHAWSSVWWFFEPDGTFREWYVNLEVPQGRSESTVDRTDGVLDVVVRLDGSWDWKDEDEAKAAVDAGVFPSACMAQLRDEGERMIVLAKAGRFPFDGTWCDYRPDPTWPLPTLPSHLGR